MNAVKRYLDFIALSACYSALLALAAVVPWWICAVAGACATALVIERRRRAHRRKMGTIQQRLANLRSEGLLIEDKARGSEEDVMQRMIMALLADLERTLFKLVEKNIQLLSIKEIGRTIISSLDEQRLMDSVFEYLGRGVGYKETAFIMLRKKKRAFQAIISIEQPSRLVRRSLTLSYADLAGPQARSCIIGKSFLIKDASMHPLFTAGGEQLFPGSTMTSYLCVPLLKSVESAACGENEDCALRATAAERDGTAPIYLGSEECLGCPHMPLLGALVVTDGYRGTPLTNVDQVTLETVASLVSSNMENWYLYQELRQEELFRERVIEGMLNGVFVIDRAGSVTLANRTARDMSQYKQRHVRSLGIGELIVGESGGGNGGSPVLRVFDRAAPLTYREAYLRRRDGMHVPIRMNVAPMTGEDGEVQGAIIEFIDLSEMKRMEEEIRYLDRLAVLGRFTSAVAHEIRNPLTGIAAGIQYLNRSQALSDEQRENISFILNEVDRLNRIVTDLFKVAKPRDLLCQTMAVADLVDRSRRSLADQFAGKKISLAVSIGDGVPPIEIDPDQIIQVLINLLKNAAEAAPEGGEIRVRAFPYRGGDPEVVWERDRELVCVEISDDGPGIEREDREKIWEPFFSRKKGGTGLGLFVSQSIVQRHQGRISVASTPGAGTTFKVYLPITRPHKGGQVEAGHSARR
ncbi:MAG: PAS domain S-box protein [Candidatus Latescibacterota bacterium]|jgi:PAS domain S-box-containing protein|nr:MAG: PAS domain S-box protein [Candidatus Latescibacterota bacterium]